MQEVQIQPGGGKLSTFFGDIFSSFCPKFLLRQEFRQHILDSSWPTIMLWKVKSRLQNLICELDFRSLCLMSKLISKILNNIKILKIEHFYLYIIIKPILFSFVFHQFLMNNFQSYYLRQKQNFMLYSCVLNNRGVGINV